ncbi:MAG TPA: bifunctional ADP-dependent NAD(P)H-hydrate dehydratase/NAD(P)H-hydrate epimerase, partial [Phycisphaerales bacterium]|nr:bifunctional ADP-dependent NAD(P)H-hydrate dehydratase/NAD(P)H-hydrate epimerase [Phycisphaerales bacterium]
LAVDLPSGMDADSGRALGHAVRADRTATFVGWKAGFLDETGRDLLGRIEVVEIGIPEVLKQRHGRPARA